nr:hypothetical protein BaRGS_030768 [Batillaria attramentaria]
MEDSEAGAIFIMHDDGDEDDSVPVEYGRARLDSLTGHDQLELRVEQLATRHQGQQLQLTQQEVDELLDHTARCCDHHERLQNVRQARDFMLQLQHIFDQHGLLGRNCQQQQQQSESGEPDPTTPEETERVPTRARRGSGGGISPRRPHQQAQPREVPAVTSVLQRLPIQAHFQPPIQQIGGSEAVDVYDDNNPVTTYPTKHYPLPPAFQAGCQEHWTWSQTDKSHEARLCGPRNITAFFHPNWSNGTAGVRGNRPLNGGVHFWEVRVASRVFGTSMMVGVGTRRVRLHVDAFVNMLGEDSAGWGLSHKGLLWHGGRNRPYTAPFKENVATVIGVLFDGLQGTLTFYKDGQCLGPAFTDLDKVEEDLFPVVCSTAAKTEMTLGARRRAYLSLQDRSRASILTSLPTDKKLACSAVLALPLPNPLRQYLLEQVNSNAL